MLTVHHLEKSRSHRVLWLLEELGLPYELVLYKRDPKTMLAPPELRRVHPLGKSPVVVDEHDGQTDVLAESGHILETLVERYGEGRLAPPRGSPDFLRYRYWLHYAEGSAMPPLLLKLVAAKIATAPVPFFIRPITRQIAKQLDRGFVTPQLETHLDHIERELGRSAFLAGDALTAADIQMSFPMEAAAQRANALAGRPNLARWLAAVRARPAYQRAIERGGPIVID